MDVRARFMSGLARQLGRPEGVRGRVVARLLNRGNRTVVSAAVTATGVKAGQVAADIGFGGGVGLRPLLDLVSPGGHVHGIEVSETAVAMARRRYRRESATSALTLHAGDLVDLPLPEHSLDAAITVNTVYFVDDLPAALAELARTLRPGGRLVIGVGDPAAMRAMPFTAQGFRLRPLDELIAAMRDAGFTGVRDDRVGGDEGAFHLLVGDAPSPTSQTSDGWSAEVNS